MSPEAQRIAIAEACGWTGLHVTVRPLSGIRDIVGVPPRIFYELTPPDYLGDLNAMHDAETILEDRDECWECRRYANALESKLTRDDHHQQGPSLFGFLHATAAQRAEAFLRTVGKWDDSK